MILNNMSSIYIKTFDFAVKASGAKHVVYVVFIFFSMRNENFDEQKKQFPLFNPTAICFIDVVVQPNYIVTI